MFNPPLISRLIAALGCTATAGNIESTLEFDPNEHEVIGKISPSERGLCLLMETLHVELDAEQATFDRAAKHSDAEKISSKKLAMLDDFISQVDDLISLSVFERLNGKRTGRFVTGFISDGTIVMFIEVAEETNKKEVPEHRTLQ